MKIGSVVYATDQGLGILAKSFFDNGIVTDVFLIEHGSRRTHHKWYPEATPTCPARILNVPAMKAFAREMDAMLFFETPFAWELLPFCKQHGIKTFLMPMHECMPKELPYQPDRFINPSHLDHQIYRDRGKYIPVPVSVEWKQRETCTTFVHNSGHGGLRGRNGTKELLEAFKYVQSPARIIVRSQIGNDDMWGHEIERGPKMTAELHVGNVPYNELYGEGDCFVFPEKFNGLSLPLQEARASGMLVMATNRFPMNYWLPIQPLIPPSGYAVAEVSGRMRSYAEASIDPRDIAEKIDEWYGRDISEYSRLGKEWAELMSWEALKPVYLEELAR